LNFPTAASVRALKTARQSKVHPLRPNRVRAAPVPPVKATCFKHAGLNSQLIAIAEIACWLANIVGESKRF
jgi:hypothetical protein